MRANDPAVPAPPGGYGYGDGKTMERLTRLFYRAIDVLLFEGPKTTGYGILLGLVIYGLVKGFTPWLTRLGVAQFFDVSLLPSFFYVAAGTLLTNLIASTQRKLQSPVPEEMRALFATIEIARREGGISATEAQQRYLMGIDLHIEQTRNKFQARAEIKPEPPRPARRPRNR